MNTISLVGRVVNEPTVKTTTTGKDIHEFRFVVRNPYKTKDDGDDFFSVRFFNPREGVAKFINEYVSKGVGLWVSGSMRCSQYEKNGDKVSWWYVEGRDIGFCPSSDRPNDNAPRTNSVPAKPNEADDYDPFA